MQQPTNSGMGFRSRAGRARPLALAALVVVVGGAAAWYTFGRSAEAAPGTPAAGADLVAVRRASFDITTTATGELEAKNQIEIRSRLESSTTIQEIAPEGARVKAGDLLIRLNADKLEQDLNEQMLQVESARAELVAAENAYNIQLNENESKLRQTQLKVDLAELALQQWLEGEVKTTRQKNQLAMNRAQLEVERLADKFLKSQNLFEQGFLSKDELDRDEVSYIEAQSAWINAHLEHDVYESYQYPQDEKQKRSDVEEAAAELQRVTMNNEIELTSKEAARTNRRRQLMVREAALAKLQRQHESASLFAPTDGLVVYATSIEASRWGGNDGPLQIGQEVRPNELLIALPDTSEMVASVRVHESLAGRIRKGMTATIRIDALGAGRQFAGAVESIGVLAETGGWRDPDRREYRVRLRIADAEVAENLKPSMRCEAQIVMGRVEDALAVPVQAVFSSGPVRFVYVPEGTRFARRPIQLGRRSDTMAEIVSGLEDGSRVLVRQPAPGEIIEAPWDKSQLAAAGYSLDDKGNPAAPAGSTGRGPRAGGQPAAVTNASPTAAPPPSTTPGADAAAFTSPAVPAAENASTAAPSTPPATSTSTETIAAKPDETAAEATAPSTPPAATDTTAAKPAN